MWLPWRSSYNICPSPPICARNFWAFSGVCSCASTAVPAVSTANAAMMIPIIRFIVPLPWCLDACRFMTDRAQRRLDAADLLVGRRCRRVVAVTSLHFVHAGGHRRAIPVGRGGGAGHVAVLHRDSLQVVA